MNKNFYMRQESYSIILCLFDIVELRKVKGHGAQIFWIQVRIGLYNTYVCDNQATVGPRAMTSSKEEDANRC